MKAVDAQIYEKIADIDTVMIAAGSNKAYRSGTVITFGEMELAVAKNVLPQVLIPPSAQETSYRILAAVYTLTFRPDSSLA